MEMNLGLSLELRRPWQQTITGAGTFSGRCAAAERSIVPASMSNSAHVSDPAAVVGCRVSLFEMYSIEAHCTGIGYRSSGNGISALATLPDI
jgi:hypothetical protein